MPPPVYTTRFIGANINGPGSVSYVVPDGHRAVVKHVSGEFINADTPINQQITAYVQTSGGDVPIFFEDEYPPFYSGFTNADCEAVAYAGETIVAEANTPGCEWAVNITGFLFVDP